MRTSLLRLLPCGLLLQGCALFGSKGPETPPVSQPPAAVAAEPQPDTATAAPPTDETFRPSAPNEIVSEKAQAERRRAAGDLFRTGLATSVEQSSPGILRVGVGKRFSSHQARDYYFTQLAFAYDSWRAEGRPLVIELWDRGAKIGEFTNRSFSFEEEQEGPTAVATPPAQGVTPSRSGAKARDHSGFNIGLGLGAGSMDFACHGCDFPSETGFSGFLSIAGSLGEKTLVGIEGTGWTKSHSDSTARVYSLTAHVTEYLTPRSGFFVRAGIGLVGYREDTDLGDRTASAAGFSGRVGYDLRAGKFSVVPYVGLVRTFGGADVKRDGEDDGLNVAISNLQFGIGIAMP